MIQSNDFKDKNNRTWVEISEIFGKDNRHFMCRVINDDGVLLNIAGDDMLDYIKPKNGRRTNEEGFICEPIGKLSARSVAHIAENVYDNIYYFCTRQELTTLSDEELLELIRN